MITFGKVTLTGKVIKDIFKDLGLDSQWCYNTSAERFLLCRTSVSEGARFGVLVVVMDGSLMGLVSVGLR